MSYADAFGLGGTLGTDVGARGVPALKPPDEDGAGATYTELGLLGADTVGLGDDRLGDDENPPDEDGVDRLGDEEKPPDDERLLELLLELELLLDELLPAQAEHATSANMAAAIDIFLKCIFGSFVSRLR